MNALFDFHIKMEDVGFKDLLQKDKSVAIDKNNLQKLATELFKSLNRFNSPIMWDIFERKLIQNNLGRNSF